MLGWHVIPTMEVRCHDEQDSGTHPRPLARPVSAHAARSPASAASVRGLQLRAALRDPFLALSVVGY